MLFTSEAEKEEHMNLSHASEIESILKHSQKNSNMNLNATICSVCNVNLKSEKMLKEQVASEHVRRSEICFKNFK